MFLLVDLAVVDFKDRWRLLLFLVVSMLTPGCWRAAPLKQRGPYLLSTLRQSSQYWAKEE